MGKESQQQPVVQRFVPNAQASGVMAPVVEPLSLPAVPAPRQADPAAGKGPDKLEPVVKSELRQLLGAFSEKDLANLVDPEGKSRQAMTDQAANNIKAIRKFLEIAQKQIGDGVIVEGIAMSLPKFLSTKGGPAWTSQIAAKNLEAEAKEFTAFLKNDGGRKTTSKSFKIPKLDGLNARVAEAMSIGGQGDSFFGNVYIKVLGPKPFDPAHPPGGDEKEVKDLDEMTLKYAHNTFSIIDGQHPAPPMPVKTPAEMTAALTEHFRKFYLTERVKGANSFEIEMLMEYNSKA